VPIVRRRNPPADDLCFLISKRPAQRQPVPGVFFFHSALRIHAAGGMADRHGTPYCVPWIHQEGAAMKTATTSYVLMLVLLAAGLWIVLRAGNALRAVPDISGEWVIDRVEASRSDHGPSHVPAGRLYVEQSGRFVQVRVDRDLPLAARVIEVQWPPSSPGPGGVLILEIGNAPSERMVIELYDRNGIRITGLPGKRDAILARRSNPPANSFHLAKPPSQT
jgi:hypothetical protein